MGQYRLLTNSVYTVVGVSIEGVVVEELELVVLRVLVVVVVAVGEVLVKVVPVFEVVEDKVMALVAVIVEFFVQNA